MRRSIAVVPVLALLISVFVFSIAGQAFEDDYYKESPLFHYYPASDAPRWTIGRLGPALSWCAGW